MVDFSKSHFVSIDGKHCFTQNRLGVGVCITLNEFLGINIHGEKPLISTQWLWTKHYFASSRDKISFIFEKVLKVITRLWEKGLMCLKYFGDERVRTGENYISFPNSRELVDYIPFLIHRVLRKEFDIFRCLKFDWEMHSMLIEVCLRLWKRFEVLLGFEKWFEVIVKRYKMMVKNNLNLKKKLKYVNPNPHLICGYPLSLSTIPFSYEHRTIKLNPNKTWTFTPK